MKKDKTTALERKPSKGLERRLAGDTRGLSTVEYLILLVVIAVASIGVWREIGGKVKGHAETSRDSIGDLSVDSGSN